MATRTNAKEMLINALNNDFLPEGFAEFLTVALPEFDNSDLTVEAAIQWEGKLSRYLCNIFTLFQGLYPLEIPLRMGQKNATQQALLLASLQATRTVGAYYTDDAKATAAAMKETIEGLTPQDGKVTLPEEVWQELCASSAGLVSYLQQEAGEGVESILDFAESLANGLMDLSGAAVEGMMEYSESAWMGLRSLSRALVESLSGEE